MVAQIQMKGIESQTPNEEYETKADRQITGGASPPAFKNLTTSSLRLLHPHQLAQILHQHRPPTVQGDAVLLDACSKLHGRRVLRPGVQGLLSNEERFCRQVEKCVKLPFGTGGRE